MIQADYPFTVSLERKWNGETRTRVRSTEYDAPELYMAKGQKVKDALSKLINGQQVELRTAYKVDRGRLSVKCLSGAETSLSFSPSIEYCLKLKTVN